MNRRSFLSTGFLGLGGVLIGANFNRMQAMGEVSNTFKYPQAYDLVISGAGMEGFFSALEASRKGLKVLLLDKRTSPGFNIAAKRKLWLTTEGIEDWEDRLLDLFCPQGEHREIEAGHLTGLRNSCWKNELLLFAGSLKKGILRSLLTNKVDVLLATDMCGIMVDSQQQVGGVLVASKHGLFTIPCGSFMDATDNNLLSRHLFNQPYSIREAEFVMELEGAAMTEKELFRSPVSLSVINDILHYHRGKKFDDHALLSFRFHTQSNDACRIEQQARMIAYEVSKHLPQIDESLKKARLRLHAQEASLFFDRKADGRIPVGNYTLFENESNDYSCRDITEMMEKAKDKISKLSRYNDRNECRTIYTSTGKIACKHIEDPVRESGKELVLNRFDANLIKPVAESTEILIAGGGTAGAMAALSAVQKNKEVTLVEFFNDLGGTKIPGGVNDYYFGYQEHPFIRNQKAELKQIASAGNLKLTMPRACMYLSDLQKTNCNLVLGAIICGVEKKENLLKGIIVSQDGKLRKMVAPLTIDATGDGDVAYFAGERYEVGDSRMGITQNYSHWDIPFRQKKKDYNRDYDIIDSTLVSEYQRGLYLAHYESHFYDFYPMQATRESRRPHALHQLNMADILSNRHFPDTIVQARSDYDPHYFSSSELSRCAMMLPHFDNKERVNIPYRSIVPKTIDGLLLSGKAIGQTYKALQHTRMSADVTVLGYVTGMIAASIVEQEASPRDFDVSPVQRELIAQSFLTAGAIQGSGEDQRTDKIIVQLIAGDKTALVRCSVLEKEKALPLLSAAYKTGRQLLLAKALAWFGDTSGESAIINELAGLYKKEKEQGHPASYLEVYDSEILYWNINQDIAFLAMSGSKKARSIIRTILSETVSGGPRVASPDTYKAERIDLQLIPYYNRIVNLCFYIERNPDRMFIKGLEKLSQDENIRGFKTKDYDKTRWAVYSANLELFIAAAATRCGSEAGIKLLIDYLSDIHSVFRNFARKELTDVSRQDFAYEQAKWLAWMNNNKISACPLVKNIEW